MAAPEPLDPRISDLFERVKALEKRVDAQGKMLVRVIAMLRVVASRIRGPGLPQKVPKESEVKEWLI